MVLTLFAALLVFGCIGDGTTTATPTTGSPSEGAGEPSEQAPTAAPTEAAEGGLFEGMDYAGLLASGQSGECTVIVTGEEYSGVTRMWFANNKARSETEMLQDGQTLTVTAIYKDGKTYSTFPDSAKVEGSLFADCDWLEFSPDAAEQDYAETETYSAPDLEDVPETSFECHAAVVSASKFDTLGNVCNMQEMMDALTGGQELPDMTACEGLEGQELADCLVQQMG
ncbi:hypothetical protein AUJ15_03620 [Candidatus Micrarchaeota archaeon CG1_02_55_41]|nr:MAG: hypothetical protein AUJ15_03620 [Candidatus Micrarchaeota archaeon CG1_02_55_41]